MTKYKGILIRFITLFALSTLLTFTGLSNPASSQEIPPSCDADYYDVLKARSYAEGKREMETAQRIILKADSVLEYSCFHIDVDHLGNQGARFSENGLVQAAGNPAEFDGGINIYGGNLDNALALVVEAPLVQFLSSFSHLYGGGTFTIIPPAAAGCNPMNIVFYASKCENFDPEWWVRFEDLASDDIRILPEPCTGYDDGRTTLISAAIGSGSSYPGGAAYPSPGASGGIDSITPYIDEMGGACSGAGNDPIRTGVTAKYSDGSTQQDAICVKPGCYFNGTSCQ